MKENEIDEQTLKGLAEMAAAVSAFQFVNLDAMYEESINKFDFSPNKQIGRTFEK